MIKGLHHADIIIPRGAEDKARQFYCQILGLKEIEKPSELKRNGGLWLEAGNAQVHLSIQDGYDPSKTKAHLAYEVDNLGETKQLLKDKGFEVVDNISVAGLTRANVRDPFGNRIEILQRV